MQSDLEPRSPFPHQTLDFCFLKQMVGGGEIVERMSALSKKE